MEGVSRCHRPLVSCLSGLYGCRWRRHERSCTPPGDCLSFALLAATFCLTLVFLYFWGQAKNDYNDFDWWVPATLARRSLYLRLWLQLLAVCLMSEGQKLHLHWSHKVTDLRLVRPQARNVSYEQIRS
uniref:Uncharacterized protein n=1 Tax=Scophthalmus maximus TaxID=52904 RepID=A0A8D3D0N8_SCOMX